MPSNLYRQAQLHYNTSNEPTFRKEATPRGPQWEHKEDLHRPSHQPKSLPTNEEEGCQKPSSTRQVLRRRTKDHYRRRRNRDQEPPNRHYQRSRRPRLKGHQRSKSLTNEVKLSRCLRLSKLRLPCHQHLNRRFPSTQVSTTRTRRHLISTKGGLRDL